MASTQQSVRPPELGREISRKVKAVIMAIIVVAVSTTGLVSYYWINRTVSVTFVESGLPAGSNWSAAMNMYIGPPTASHTADSRAGSPSTVTVSGLKPDTWYGTRFYYPGGYVADAGHWGMYNKPLPYWQNPSWPIGIKTGSNSSIVKIIFDPFVDVTQSFAQVYLNNQTYGLLDGGNVGAFTGAYFAPQPPNDTTVGYGYEFGPGTMLKGDNSAPFNLTGSFNVTAVNLQSNVTGLSIIGLNRTLPWHVYISPVGIEIIEINVYVPREPIIATQLYFTLTIENWNPNAH